MSDNNLAKATISLMVKARRASNRAAVVLVAVMAYTISQWHSSMGIDNFTNVLVMLIVLAINLKLYNIYLRLNSIDDTATVQKIEGIYKNQKREYYQLLRVSLWMTIILAIAKLLFLL